MDGLLSASEFQEIGKIVKPKCSNTFHFPSELNISKLLCDQISNLARSTSTLQSYFYSWGYHYHFLLGLGPTIQIWSFLAWISPAMSISRNKDTGEVWCLWAPFRRPWEPFRCPSDSDCGIQFVYLSRMVPRLRFESLFWSSHCIIASQFCRLLILQN